MKNIAGVVLAGGQSRRMGEDKSQLQLNNKSLLEHEKSILYAAGFSSVYISGINGIKDQFQEKGPLSGILSCLNELQRFDYVIFIPVDMPLLNANIIKKITKEKRNELSNLSGHLFPLIIKNNKRIRKILKNQIENDNLSIYQLVKQLKSYTIEHDFNSKYFFNANSPKQWLEVKQLLQLQQQ